jgi:tetraacyldisaccharide 4'-kinase
MALRPPAFWWRSPGAAVALWPLARLWGWGAARRMEQPPRLRPGVAVICVGNYVVGGAGKTPTVIALARLARSRGFKPGILARGYGGKAKAPVLVDPLSHHAEDVGDEALILANAAPTVASPDRAAGAERLLDDGLQDPALAKDLSIVAVDATTGVGNGHVLPLGPLRAPLAAQLRRTDVLLVIGEGAAAEPVVRMAARAGRPVLWASLKPVTTREWRKAKLHAFAGIGRPQKFFDSLAAVGAELVRTRGFPDHHVFTQSEASQIVAAADIDQCRLVTTEKDMARLAGASGARARLRDRTEVFAVTLEFENPEAVAVMIEEAVRKSHMAQTAAGN